MGAIGPIGIARIHSKPTVVERDRSHINRSDTRLFSFLLQARGSSVFSHYGHETRMEEGDFTLCEQRRASSLQLRGGRGSHHAAHLARGVEEVPPRRRSGCAACGCPRARASPARRRTWRRSCGLSWKPGCRRSSAAWWRGTSSISWRRRTPSCSRHRSATPRPSLRDGSRPSGSSKGSCAIRISRRARSPARSESRRAYLRMLFRGEEESVSRYILRRRLEGMREAALERLVERPHASRTSRSRAVSTAPRISRARSGISMASRPVSSDACRV